MTDFKSYRAESRKNYGSSDDPLSLPQLQAGCLMRIADATEKMAQRHTELISSRDYFEGAYRRESEFRRIAERSNAALRGQVTKLRKRLAAMKGGAQ